MFRKRKRRTASESPSGGGRSLFASQHWPLAATWGELPVPGARKDVTCLCGRRFASQVHLPTQAEIRRECRKIRRKWSPCERLRRKVARRRPAWTPPILALDELQAILSEDQANGWS